MAKKNFYAVATGRNPGIYTNWPETEKQVKGFPAARYKGFTTLAEAEEWVKLCGQVPRSPKRDTPKKQSTFNKPALADNCVEIYTDGGALNNPGPGGYGVVILSDNERKELHGGFRHTTNNRMELTACIMGLSAITDLTRPIALFSDSSYVVNGINKGWAKGWRRRGWKKSNGEAAINPDLWEKLLDLAEKLNVTFHWVKGHAGHPLNERCDQLAVQSARGKDLKTDTGYSELSTARAH